MKNGWTWWWLKMSTGWGWAFVAEMLAIVKKNIETYKRGNEQKVKRRKVGIEDWRWTMISESETGHTANNNDNKWINKKKDEMVSMKMDWTTTATGQ